MKSICCTLALMTLLCLASPASLVAQSLTAGPNIIVHDTPFVPSVAPSIAASADGGFLAGWWDSARNHARSFSPADVPLGGVRQASSAGTGELSPPRAATLASGRSVVVWSDSHALSYLELDLRIVARFLDASGNLAGDEIELARVDRASRTPWSPWTVAVAAERGGGFVAAWGLSGGIRARRFDEQGSPAGPEIVITGDGLFPSLAAIPGGSFVVTWFHQTQGPPFGEVLLRVFRPDGLPATAEIPVADPLGLPSFDPQVSADDAGRLVVAWSENHFSDTSLESTSWIRSRRFGPDGQPLAPAVTVAETQVYGRGFLVGDVAARPEGSFLVSWLEADTLTGGPSDGSYIDLRGEVWARAFTGSDTPLGDAFRVASTAGGDQRAGEAAATPDGWIVSWTRAIDGAGIFARRFSLSCGTGNELCLHGGRFRARVDWLTSPSGPQGEGQPIGLTADTGAFWFFDPANVELVVKVLDGTPVNNHFWVFYGSLTDVAFDLTVTDTLTGLERTYHNPAGTMASRADTQAFPRPVSDLAPREITLPAPLASQPLAPAPEILAEVLPAEAAGHASVIAGANGDLLAVWSANGSILGRLHDASGAPRSTDPVLLATGTWTAPAFQVLLRSDGYLLVWFEDPPGIEDEVRARFFDASLQPVQPDVVLASAHSIAGPAGLAAAAYPSGGFVVGWNDGLRFMARRFDPQGNPVGTAVLVAIGVYALDVTTLPNGGFACTWTGEPADVWLRIYRPQGAPAGGPLLVRSASQRRLWDPRVSADAAGRLVVGWSEAGLTPPSAIGSSLVQVQRFDAAGITLGPAITVDARETGTIELGLSDLSARPDGTFLVVWGEFDARVFLVEPPEHTLHGEVWARAFAADGTTLGPEKIQVPVETEGRQLPGRVQATADGWLVDWTFIGEESTSLFARRISSSPGCGAAGLALCLGGGRFQVEAAWHVPATGASGPAQPVGLTGDTGAFWFFAPANLELIVKVLDGTAINGHFWVFYGSLTDVEFDLTITDTQTGQQRTYHNPAGIMASRADTVAF